jgi:hypothetical protein
MRLSLTPLAIARVWFAHPLNGIMAPPHHSAGQLQNPFEEQQSLILQRICGNVVRVPVSSTASTIRPAKRLG